MKNFSSPVSAKTKAASSPGLPGPIPHATEKELENVTPEATIPTSEPNPEAKGEVAPDGDFKNEAQIQANIASGVNDQKAPDVSVGELLDLGHQIEEKTEQLRDKLAYVTQANRLELGARYEVLKRMAGVTDRSLVGSQAPSLEQL